jgi:Nif-specific ferredoxin III
MTATFSVTLPGGEIWIPTFVESLNQEKCIGCGRCFKICPRGVLELVGLNAGGDYVRVEGGDEDDDDDDDDEEYEKKVMTIAHKELCIGCTACSKICPKKCYTHAAGAI